MFNLTFIVGGMCLIYSEKVDSCLYAVKTYQPDEFSPDNPDNPMSYQHRKCYNLHGCCKIYQMGKQ